VILANTTGMSHLKPQSDMWVVTGLEWVGPRKITLRYDRDSGSRSAAVHDYNDDDGIVVHPGAFQVI